MDVYDKSYTNSRIPTMDRSDQEQHRIQDGSFFLEISRGGAFFWRFEDDSFTEHSRMPNSGEKRGSPQISKGTVRHEY